MSPPIFHRLFVANRGEVAARIARACDALGIVPVLGVSEADASAPYVRGREHVVLGPGRAAQSYLDMTRLVQAAKQSRCSALHPGWGFLSENPAFNQLCAQHGITFIGPPAHVQALMGRKSPAKRAMGAAGLALIPGSDGPVRDAEEALEVARRVGYPILFKAEAGGGGRGMRIARSEAEVRTAYDDALAEASAAFGVARVFVEKLLEGGRHVEIQILADRYGRAIHLGERDCTVQRNHQKLIEESPSPALSDEVRRATLAAAVRAAASIGYVGAGTMEFLLDCSATSSSSSSSSSSAASSSSSSSASPAPPAPASSSSSSSSASPAPPAPASSSSSSSSSSSASAAPSSSSASSQTGVPRFMEMNTRLQVEHPVSEMRSGIDLMTAMIRVCAGHPLGLEQDAITLRGHAIECRINAEDPHDGFRPSPGAITRFVAPQGGGVRVDTHVEDGYVVPPFYDSLIAKVIVHAADRARAIDAMIAALEAMVVEGVKTTIPMHLAVLRSEEFRTGRYDTRKIPGWPTSR